MFVLDASLYTVRAFPDSTIAMYGTTLIQNSSIRNIGSENSP